MNKHLTGPIEGILEEFRGHVPGMSFPKEAVEAAIARREEITPLLMEALKVDGGELSDAEEFLLVCAIYLLAQFREVRALPLIIEIFGQPAGEVGEFLEELVTEDLGRILASISGGKTAAIKALVENGMVDGYVRSAALEALVVLVATGQVPRSEVVDYYRTLFETLPRQDDSFVWTGLILACCDLHPGELLAEIQGVYDDGLVDSKDFPSYEIEELAAEPVEEAMERLKADVTFINDVVEEMHWWACFQPLDGEDGEDGDEDGEEDGEEAGAGELEKSVKVGRNDPCPCGSKKKFKKCCGQAI